MKGYIILCLHISIFFELCVAPGPNREVLQEMEDFMKTEGLGTKQAQDREYFRYVLSIIKILSDDPAFIYRMDMNASDAEIRKGKLTNGLMRILSKKTRGQLDELKKAEVAHQRFLLANNKKHMADAERNEWNPIHLDDKETFTQDDMTRLLSKYNNLQDILDEKRRREFKDYEMEKELKHRKVMKEGTEDERAEEDRKYKLHHEKKHERMHDPGHKAQMEEVWEKEDGLDKEAFNYKTFFNLHDKNSDGYADRYELETYFLHDLDKAYPENEPDTDLVERQEEMERMREKAMEMDVDDDGLISQKEFLTAMEKKEAENDDEWIPLIKTKQFSEEDLNDFRAQLEKDKSKN